MKEWNTIWTSLSENLTLSYMTVKYKMLCRMIKRRPVSACALIVAVLLLFYQATQVKVRKRTTNFIPGNVIPKFRLKASRNISESFLNGLLMPNIIHQIWKSHDIPELFHKWMPSVVQKNPEWEYWFWTDNEMRKMIEYHYPGYLALYDSYPTPIYRADAFRYFVLHQYGGVYADLDIEFLHPIRYEIKLKRCIFSIEPESHAHFLTKVPDSLVSNALIACDSSHPFLSFIIDNLQYHTGVGKWHSVLYATGPFFLTSLYKEYKSENPAISWDERTDVHLADPEVFQPTVDESMVDRIREMCLEHKQNFNFIQSKKKAIRESNVCNRIVSHDFHNGPTDRSVTDHHWTHTWGGIRNDPWGILNSKREFNINDIRGGREIARVAVREI